jgi:hypothetical protein
VYLEEDYGKIAIKSKEQRKRARKKRRESLTVEQRRRRQRLSLLHLNLLPPVLFARIGGAIRRHRVEKGSIKSRKKLIRYRATLKNRISRLKGRDRQRAKDRIAEAKKLIKQIDRQLGKGEDMGSYGDFGTNASSAIRKGMIPVVGPQAYMVQPYSEMGFYPGAYAGSDDLGFIFLRRMIWGRKLKRGELTQEDAKEWLPKIDSRITRLSGRKSSRAQQKLASLKALRTKVNAIANPKTESDDLDGIIGDYWTGYTDWWKQQNAVVKVAAPAAFLFAVYQIPAVKRRVKKAMKKKGR